MLPSCSLPGELIESVLLKLPVKSLLRFKAVCKPWYDFISSPYFINLHLRRPLTTNNLLILSDNFADDDSDFNLLTQNYPISDSARDDISCSQISPPFPFGPEDEMQILDSRNGLVCLSIRNHSNIILWNPATKKFRFLGLPDCRSFGTSFTYAGLGYVEATNDYKLVRMVHPVKPRSIGFLWVYTLSADSWKQLDIDFNKFVFQPRPPVFVNGCLHWLTNRHISGNLIGALNVAEEVASCMPVPDSYGYRSEIVRQLTVIRGSLSVVVFSTSHLKFPVMEIWLMTEYGVQGSWSNQFKLEALSAIARPIGSWKDGELIFRYDEGASKKIMFYDPFTKRKKYFTKFQSFSFQTFNYIESLESVETGRRLLNAD